MNPTPTNPTLDEEAPPPSAGVHRTEQEEGRPARETTPPYYQIVHSLFAPPPLRPLLRTRARYTFPLREGVDPAAVPALLAHEFGGWPWYASRTTASGCENRQWGFPTFSIETHATGRRLDVTATRDIAIGFALHTALVTVVFGLSSLLSGLSLGDAAIVVFLLWLWVAVGNGVLDLAKFRLSGRRTVARRLRSALESVLEE